MIGASLPAINSAPEIKVTKENLARFDTLLENHAPIRFWRAVEFLVRELTRAAVVDDDNTPGNVVTMRSRVKFCEEENETPAVVTLVYPGESHLHEDAISVLTPLGAALIGLSEGQSISYPRPDGTLKTITVIEVLYQPEAARRSRTTSSVRSA